MGGAAPPPTPPLFLAGKPASKLTNPFQTMMGALCFQMRRSAQPQPPEERGNICLLSYENSDLMVEVEFSFKNRDINVF